MMYRILGTLVLAAAGTIAYLTLNPEADLLSFASKAPCAYRTPAEQLTCVINTDFTALRNSGQLPPEWDAISTVEYKMGSNLARAILGKARPSIQRVQDGSAYLEMEVMDLPDEENPGIIIQASLFDIQTKNKIFEIGRTYTMSELNSPEPQQEKKSRARTTKIKTH